MIRSIMISDAPALCAIYNHYVLNTAISFEEEAVNESVMRQRIAASQLPWLVLLETGALERYGILAIEAGMTREYASTIDATQ